MLAGVVVAAAFLQNALGQEVVSSCPAPNGFFADSVQCDKYYQCADNVMTEKLCPDGMAFNDANHRVETCDFLFQVDCEGRPDLQPPQATENCPRQNGYFPHPTSSNCNQFYYCAGGTGSLITCPETLVFSTKTGTCVWPDEAGRTGDCMAKNVVNFTCPTVPQNEAVAHPRYADPDDCQFFYVCINGKTPRHNGCNFGQVFSTEIKACDSPKNVPVCKDYYTEYFEEYFASLGGSATGASQQVIKAAEESGYKIPGQAPRIRVRPSGGAPSRRRTPAEVAAAAATAGPQESNVPPRRRPATRPGRRPVRLPATTAAPTTTPAPPPPPPPPDTYEYDYYDAYEYPLDGPPAPAPTLARPAPAPLPARPAPRPTPVEEGPAQVDSAPRGTSETDQPTRLLPSRTARRRFPVRRPLRN